MWGSINPAGFVAKDMVPHKLQSWCSLVSLSRFGIYSGFLAIDGGVCFDVAIWKFLWSSLIQKVDRGFLVTLERVSAWRCRPWSMVFSSRELSPSCY